MSRRKTSSRFSQVINTYEGRTVEGFSAWLRWSGQVYLALQLDALAMNIAYILLLVLVAGLSWILGMPVLSGLAFLVWLMMPLAFMGKIRRRFIRSREPVSEK